MTTEREIALRHLPDADGKFRIKCNACGKIFVRKRFALGWMLCGKASADDCGIEAQGVSRAPMGSECY